MTKPFVIDSQVHIWGRDIPQRPWPPESRALAHRSEPLSAAELLILMDEAGVDRAVLVPPSWEGDRNDLVLDAIAAHPDRFAAMLRVSLDQRLDAAELAALCASPGVLGVRLTFGRGRQRAWLTDGTAEWFWDVAERADIAVMCWVPDQVDHLGRVAAAHPGLRLVLDHVGLDVIAPPEAVATAVDVANSLARLPNVAVKASALPAHASGGFPFTSLHEPIRRLVGEFGAERVFFGTDLTRLDCTYAEAVELFASAVPGLAAEERALVLGGALAGFLRWPLPGAASA